MVSKFKIKKDSNGSFLDLLDPHSESYITDYLNFRDTEIHFNADGVLSLNTAKGKIQVSSIDRLQNACKLFVEVSMQILEEQASFTILSDDISIDGSPTYSIARQPKDFQINESSKNLIVEQLVFDLLFDIYINNSPKISGYQYANDMRKKHSKFFSDLGKEYYNSEAFYKQIRRVLDKTHKKMQETEIQYQLQFLGLDPQKFTDYFTPESSGNSYKYRVKYIWDGLFFNNCLEITSRQFRRELTRHNRNYSYNRLCKDLDAYNHFVSTMIPSDNESAEKYFKQTMEFYYLESYKRIDFMLRLSSVILKNETANDSISFLLLKQFTPEVTVPYINDSGELDSFEKTNYYRPLVLLETKILESYNNGNIDDSPTCQHLPLYRLIRAKAYELLKYHVHFKLKDYKEAKDFILSSYNLQEYHYSTKEWNIIHEIVHESPHGSRMSPKIKLNRKQLNIFLSLNDILFPKIENPENHLS